VRLSDMEMLPHIQNKIVSVVENHVDIYIYTQH